MKKLVTLIVLTLAELITAAQQNPQLAEAEWAAAEQAYAAGRYEDALRHLDKTQEYVGYWLPNISHLRILCYNTDIIKYWGEAAAELRRYVEYADNNFNSAGFDSNRHSEIEAICEKILSVPDYIEGLRLFDAEDYAQAFPKLKVAAEIGWDIAMFELGFMYYDGYGVPQDYAQSFEWYRKAAEKGHKIAMNNLARLYYLGHGVNEDDAKAFEWYKKSADNGYVPAMTRVGECYHYGIGVAQNRNETIRWMRLAADNGDTAAKEWLAENTR